MLGGDDMSFFNIFTRKNNSNIIADVGMSSFDELFEKYGAISFEKQQNIKDIVGNVRWELNLLDGKISFNKDIVYPIQLYGTFSNKSNSWLWIWDNYIEKYPEAIVKHVKEINNYGIENHIDVFTNPYFPTTKDYVKKMAMIIVGLTNSSFYYLGEFGPGAVLVSINDSAFTNEIMNSPIKVTNYFPKFIKAYDVNHRKAFKHYIKAKGFDVIELKRTIHATYLPAYGNVKMEIQATFDKLDRLVNLDGTFKD